MSLYVRQLELGPKKNFVYLVGFEGGQEALVVDPAWDVEAVLKAAKEDGRRVSAAFLTHSHDDHMNGVAPLLEKGPLPVYAQKAELAHSPALQRLGSAIQALAPGEAFTFEGRRVETLHTPGHTPGAQCLYLEKALFSGDTLFVNVCGRCDFPGGSPEAMFNSLHRVLAPLPDDTRLYPGHDYGDIKVSTLGRERAQNPYFQLRDVESFVAFRMRPRT